LPHDRFVIDYEFRYRGAVDVVRDLARGAVRLHVLHHAALGPVSGTWMSQELGHHGYQISPGTLYPLLHDLEKQGLLVSVQRTEDGHVVRYYEATRAGVDVLERARSTLAELAAELLPTTPSQATGRSRHARPG
jgi:DNA-binding PadR family transcriptional regulator